MPSKIQVDQIAGATGSTVTLPSGQTLDLSSGTVNLPSASLSALNATNLTSGTVPSARLSLTSSDLPTVPTTKGGTGLTTIGTANQVLRVNSGATGLEYGTLAAGGITEADVWRVTTTSSSTSGTFSSNWERADTDNFTVLGTGMTEASGIFSFPSTGYYRIDFKTYGYATGVVYHIIFINMTLNNSTYDGVSLGVDSNTGSSGYVGAQTFHVVKITDIVNQKIKFEHSSNTSITFENDTTQSNTTAQFIKLAGL
jgi:hypothetical protein